jgi:dihydropteroate synthase
VNAVRLDVAAPHDRASRLGAVWAGRQTAIMAILNCTPDSFSDGGRYLDRSSAVARGEELFRQDADIIDIGGESTRPGSRPVEADEEKKRVVPVVAELRRRHPEAVLSVDTTKAEVALAGLDAGADIINDVSGAGDPRMLHVVADHGAGIVLMHMRGTPRTMQQDTQYDDVVAEVHRHLLELAAAALAAGIPRDSVWLDPGIGFGKDDDGNLRLLAALPDLAAHGHPVVIGPSAKSFIGRLTGAEVEHRLPGTLAALTPAVGVPRSVVRVHDPAAARQFLAIAE